MQQKTKIYQELVSISSEYLGPAGERFVRRQIDTHLKKKPEQITTRDLKELVDWIRLSFALLTDNNQLVDEYSSRLVALSDREGA